MSEGARIRAQLQTGASSGLVVVASLLRGRVRTQRAGNRVPEVGLSPGVMVVSSLGADWGLGAGSY